VVKRDTRSLIARKQYGTAKATLKKQK